MSKLVIIGAGGHSRALISLIEESKDYLIEGIYDDTFNASEPELISDVPVIGKVPTAVSAVEEIVLGLGNIDERRTLYAQFNKKILKENIISVHALIRPNVKLGRSNQVFPFVFINAHAIIGDNCILNSKCLIEHESIIGDHTHISVGALICGRVRIGQSCFVGAGAVVKDGVRICDDVTVGAGAVVIKDITESGIYVGNPARKI